MLSSRGTGEQPLRIRERVEAAKRVQQGRFEARAKVQHGTMGPADIGEPRQLGLR